MSPRLMLIAAIFGSALAVALGAFGAHGLEQQAAAWPDENRETRLENWDTAARYQMVHALGLGLLACWCRQHQRRSRFVAPALLGGMLLFSGSLYLYTLTGVSRWGAVTPLGGALWLLAWGAWAVAELRNPGDAE